MKPPFTPSYSLTLQCILFFIFPFSPVQVDQTLYIWVDAFKSYYIENVDEN